MTSCRHRILALLSAVIMLIFFLGNIPTVHANTEQKYCGVAFSYAVATACAEAKRSIRSAPFYDMFPGFKPQERVPADFDDSTGIQVRKRQNYQGMANYCCSNGCTLSQIANSGMC